MNKQQYYVVWIANLIICCFLILYALVASKPLLIIVPIVLFSGVLIFSLGTDLGKFVAKKVIIWFSIIAIIGTGTILGIEWFENRRSQEVKKESLSDLMYKSLQQMEEERFKKARKQLRLGLTEDEVRNLLGEPYQIDNLEYFSYWYYPRSRRITFNSKGRVKSWEGF